MPLEQINVTLGTAGHIDHGKTALVKNLTGCDTDRLKEEKERGMSIELGFAPCRIGSLQAGIVDVPGHENFVKTMVAGATSVDGVILVVAADDGIMPQTREHLEILTLLGVRHGVVALTKVDRVGADQVDLAREELAGFLRGTFLEQAPIVPVSNITGEGFDRLLEALTNLVQSIRPRRIDGVFRMPVERAFSVKGYGTVVAGVPVSGTAAIDDEVVLLPHDEAGRVKAIQVFKRNGPQVMAGQCTAINVRQWDHEKIRRGDVIATPGYFSPLTWFLCRLKLLGHERVFIKNGTAVKFHTGTTEASAAVYLMTGSAAGAGEEIFVQVRTEEPVVAGPGDRFILRALSPVQTIGGGTIVEGVARRLKRNRSELDRELTEWSKAVESERDFIEYAVKTAGLSTVRDSEVAVRTKIPLARVRTILHELTAQKRLIPLGPDVFLHQTAIETGAGLPIKLLGDFHTQTPASPGMPPEQLLQASGLAKEVLDRVMTALKASGRVVERDGRWALAEHKTAVADEDRRLMDRIEAMYRDRPFEPPEPPEVLAATKMTTAKLDKLYKILLDHRILVRVPDGLLFHRDAVERAREVLVDFIRKEGKLESVKFKYLLNTSRKYAIPLLDYFDRMGLTSRINNTRYLKAANK